MRKTLLSFAVVVFFAGAATAQTDRANLQQEVIKSSVTIYVVMATSYTMTAVDSPKMEGSFIAELQNPSTAYNLCCSFDISASTVIASAQGKACRWISKNFGSWVIQRWWRDLSLYCQNNSTVATSPVVVVQGK